MRLLRKIGDSVHPMIKLEEDFPSNHADRKIPILDLKCWLDENEKAWYEHYEKPVSTRKVLSSKSALDWKTKRNVAVSECVRRLRNCSLDLPWKEKAAFLSDYMARLKVEGYNEMFRINVLKQAIARFDGMVVAHQWGTQPLYRDKNWNRVERNRQKQNKKSNWAKDCDSVIFVQSTPNGELARQFREVVDSYPGPVKFKIVEKGGKSVNSMLKKSNPSRRVGCDCTDCLVCKVFS